MDVQNGGPIAALRRVVRDRPIPASLEAYAAKVRDHSYEITDADIERLKASGHDEDEIFEVTVAAAVQAALRSFDAGIDALRGHQ